MMTLLLMLCCFDVTDEITKTLTDEEKQTIAKMTEVEKAILDHVLTSNPIATQSGWKGIEKDALFYAETGIRVAQVIDEDEFIGTNFDVWVANAPTSNLSDGDVVDVSGRLFYCTGNKQYTTALGSTKTVMRIEVVDTDRVVAVASRIGEARGYHLFRTGVEGYVLAKPSQITKRSVMLQYLGQKKRRTVKRDTLTAADNEYLDAKQSER